MHNWPKTALFCALWVVPMMAQAQDICREVKAMILDIQQDAPLAGELHGVGGCRDFRESSGAMGIICQQVFQYRTTVASRTFSELNQAMNACLHPLATVSQDQAVNHPDFYDLYQYTMDRGTVSVSLKDKASLQRTFVFLRVTGMQAP